jgi:EF-P beta-lysylation protein EpmB
MPEDRRFAMSITSAEERSSWKAILARAIRDPDTLIDRLALGDEWREPARKSARLFPVVVPEGYLARIRRGDPNDPLLLQVLPLGAEEKADSRSLADPVGDLAARRAPGLLVKYEGRVLLIATGTCAVHCRYCFRRQYPYELEPRGLDAWEPAIGEIEADPTIREVILSGGDPLTLPDAVLGRLVARLESIPHVGRLRIHSRLPIVIPERVDAGLLTLLRRSRLVPWVVVHANHPREIDAATGAALERLVDAGIPVLNQAVLLAGINDDADTLAALCELLVEHRVQPYYLHELDPVSGAGHFYVDEARGRAIIRELRARLPGHAVPRYVREIAGAAHKIPIGEAPG